ncbi:uncharacterized protein BJ171DRAFT_486464 [Polychytrium aggregatum]|uniref:uncharacterized protein n=1 Tax=Polychytrium aggregatum TaxID=110093 RepID=UPI0022FE8EE5|nr:uncharacterized protein BJ171DRAFT_486464 [Polychytrium aggregatum]KAI9209325.1 hypothetical protein BJ171DRAFT_486464 [Polychytrium aggregatum]
MPTVNVDKETLFKELGRSYTTSEFEELCFEFGIELEDDTSEREMATKEVGAEKAKDLSDRPIYRIDIPANRYDMLCGEGIARALRTYLGLQKPVEYKLATPKKLEQLHVKPETGAVRPFVVAAILRNITFDQLAYDSFIELQEKLHNNICRKRTLVAIGTHDLDTIVGPFSYEALRPLDINFVPLNQAKSMNGEELMTFYEADRRLSKYLPIIRSEPRYPVIYDSKRTVLSLPPIINGDHSKIRLTTKNVFIECTATDLTKAKIVLNTVVTMFSQYCADKYTIEPVEIVQPDGTSAVYPDISNRKMEASVDYINKSIGIKLPVDDVAKLLTKMSLSARYSKDRRTVHVSIPPTRSDVLHPCDIMEDVAIAYGYNNIPKTAPKASTVAAPFPLNKLTDLLRREMTLSGYTEVLPLILCSHDENFAFLNKKDGGEAIQLSNPKTIEYQVVRTSLLPGILKTVAHNKKLPLPLKVFEVSDVAFKDDSIERRARNQRNLCVVYSNKTSGFEIIHGVLDRLMAMLAVPLGRIGEDAGYYIAESENPTYFPGRRADVYYNGNVIGSMGIVHPDVLSKFEIGFPCTALEINVEHFL